MWLRHTGLPDHCTTVLSCILSTANTETTEHSLDLNVTTGSDSKKIEKSSHENSENVQQSAHLAARGGGTACGGGRRHSWDQVGNGVSRTGPGPEQPPLSERCSAGGGSCRRDMGQRSDDRRSGQCESTCSRIRAKLRAAGGTASDLLVRYLI